MIALFVAGACMLGLAVFALLVRGEPGRGQFAGLGVGIVVLTLAGLAVLRLLPMPAEATAGRVVTALTLLWLAWVGVMAFVSQALRRRFPQSADWLLLTGGLATMAPAAGMIVALWIT